MFAPARLTVGASPVPDQAEAAAIRILALRGQHPEALARIDAALAKDQSALLLHLWRADALEALNRGDEARASLDTLAAAIADRQTRAGQPVELPYWLAARMATSR